MSLVDYSSSEEEEEEPQPSDPPQLATPVSRPPTTDSCISGNNSTETDKLQLLDIIASSSSSSNFTQSSLRLPDASELLNSFEAASNRGGTGNRFSTAYATDMSRKRSDLNEGVHLLPHAKIPRGNLLPSRIPPDTAGGILVPPQVRGRSNVATEDLEKLFARRQKS